MTSAGVIASEHARAFLERASELLATSLDYESTLAKVAGLAVPELADWCALDVVEEDGAVRQITSVHPDPEQEALLVELRRRYRARTRGAEGVLGVLARGEPELVEDVAHMTQLPLDPHEREIYARLHPRSYMIVALRARERTLGALTLLSTRPGRHYRSPDLQFAVALAGRCALAVDNARLYHESERALALLDTLFATAPVGLAFSDAAHRVVRINEKLAAITGRPVAEHLGKDPAELLGPAGAELRSLHRRVLESGEPVLGRELIVPPAATDGAAERVFVVSLTPVPGAEGKPVGVLATVLEETERRRMLERERAQHRDDELLARVGEVLDTSLDYATTLRNVARIAVRDFADWCVVHLMDDRGVIDQVAIAHADPAKERWAWHVGQRWPVDQRAGSGVSEVVRRGRLQVVNEITDEMLQAAARDPEHLEALRAVGVTAAVTVPMRARGRTLGAITFVSSRSGRRFEPRDVAVAVELARRAGLAVDNARLYTARSSIAHTLQTRLLPIRLPAVPGAEVAARYRAAGEFNEVGGDFYDVVACPDGDWLLVVGDVAGKGAEAAALTALARYTLRTLALERQTPSGMLRRLNDAMLSQSDSDEFCTVGLARVRISDGRAAVQLALGGHEPALLLRAGGAVEQHGRYGTLLGLLPEPELADVELDLGPGDTLVLYTDGVTDAGAPERRLGPDGLTGLLQGLRGETPARIVNALEQAAVHIQEGEPRDDIALLALRMQGGVVPAVTFATAVGGTVAVEVERGPDAPARARRAVVDHLTGRVPARVGEDAGLLVRELVESAPPGGGQPPPIGVRIAVAGERVRVEVSNPAPELDPAPAARAGLPSSGHGLFLVTQLADAWGVAPERPGAVWFELGPRTGGD